jgi:hypothetical protein
MNLEDYMIPCLTKKLFGIDCLGCGIQRALVLLVQGDFAGAFNMYPAVYSMLLFFLTIAINHFDQKRNYHYVIVTLGIITAITMVVSYLYKRIYY